MQVRSDTVRTRGPGCWFFFRLVGFVLFFPWPFARELNGCWGHLVGGCLGLGWVWGVCGPIPCCVRLIDCRKLR